MYCISVLLLSRCMDVESNLGPCGGSCQTSMQRTQECTERRFAHIMQLLAFQNRGLSRKMDTHYGSLEQAFSLFKEELLGLRDEFEQTLRNPCWTISREKSGKSSRTLDNQTGNSWESTRGRQKTKEATSVPLSVLH